MVLYTEFDLCVGRDKEHIIQLLGTLEECKRKVEKRVRAAWNREYSLFRHVILLLMCLIGKTQLLCMLCRGIGPHLAERGKSYGFFRVAAGTWGIFSGYAGDIHSKLEFVQ